MNLRIELKNGVMTAHIRGEIDHHSASGLREQIDSAAQKVKPTLLRLNFAEVPFMDSSGIGLILGRIRLLKMWGGRIALLGLSPQNRKMAELSGISSLATFEDDRKEKEQHNS